MLMMGLIALAFITGLSIQFEYALLDSVRYQLCATFAARDSVGPYAEPQSFWAHPAGRHCYALELDPRYCDVIVERWQQLTKQEARRIPAAGAT